MANKGKPITFDAKGKQRQRELEKLKGKPTGEKLTIIVKDKFEEDQPVYSVPRKLLRLNPHNGRFASNVKRLVEVRRAAGIKNPTNFNMDDNRKPNIQSNQEHFYDPNTKAEPMGGDVHQIRNMIKGQQPEDGEKITKYKELKGLMQSYQKRVANSNGQADPGIVLSDGTYVNANRRDCILEDFWEEAGKSKSGTNSAIFENIRVAICPQEVTESDVTLMELHEQESIDPRAKFNAIDTAEAIVKYYDAACSRKNLKRLDKQGRYQPSILTHVASFIEGKNKDDIIKFLNLHELSKLILRKLAGTANGKVKKDDLWRIVVADKGVSSEVGEIVEESGKNFYNAKSPTDKKLIVQQTSALVAANWFREQLKQQNKEDELELKYGFQDVKRQGVQKVLGPKSKKFTKTYFAGLDVTSTKDLKKFDKDLKDASVKKQDQGLYGQSTRFLDDIERKVSSMKDALSDRVIASKVAHQLNDADAISRITKCEKEFGSIKTLIKTKTGKQKPRPLVRKSKKTKKKKSKRRSKRGFR